LLCNDEVSLIQQRTQLVNQLQQALVEYYPAALQAFDDWTSPATWDFVIAFPTPEALEKGANVPGKSSCTLTSCGGLKPSKSAWPFLPKPRTSKPRLPSFWPKANWH